MNEIEIMQMEKNRLQSIVRKTSSDRMYTWVRNTLDLLVKKYFTIDDIEFRSQVVLVLRKLYKYYSQFEQDCVGDILTVTVYFICVQLDVLEMGNELETYDEFRAMFDMESFAEADRSAVFTYDYDTLVQFVNNYNEGYDNYLAIVGIHTILAMPYIVRI